MLSDTGLTDSNPLIGELLRNRGWECDTQKSNAGNNDVSCLICRRWILAGSLRKRR